MSLVAHTFMPNKKNSRKLLVCNADGLFCIYIYVCVSHYALLSKNRSPNKERACNNYVTDSIIDGLQRLSTVDLHQWVRGRPACTSSTARVGNQGSEAFWKGVSWCAFFLARQCAVAKWRIWHQHLVTQHCDPPYHAIGYSYTSRIYVF